MYICVKCGKECTARDTAGSMRHPYCKPCFKEVWNNDYDKYFKWLEEKHGR